MDSRRRRQSVLVVGGGISGLGAAMRLARSGCSVELWEQAQVPGGLLAPIRFRGLDCDRGAHRVHPSADPALFELSGPDWLRRPRRGCLVLRGRHLAYPPRPTAMLSALGLPGALAVGLRGLGGAGWDRARSVSSHPEAASDEGFEAFVCARLGRRAYEIFYRPYAEKVWGVPPARLSRSVAKLRVSSTAPLAFLRPQPSPAQFLYPARGMAALLEAGRHALTTSGVRIETERTATLAQLAGTDHERVLFSGVLGPLAAEAGGGADALTHRGLYLIHLALPEDAVVGLFDTWYLPEPSFWFGRVSRPDLFSPALRRRGERVLCVEIPEGRWGIAQDFLPRLPVLLDQLSHAGILRPGVAPLEVRQTFLPRVYPLYWRGWPSTWRAALERVVAADRRLLPIGRQGLFLHCNIDHCLRIAADAVAHTLAGDSPEAWLTRARAYLTLTVRD